MDANNIVTAFVTSANQYAVSQNEKNLMQLQRHLEILLCLTSADSQLSYFRSFSPLASQCMSHVVNILLDSNVKLSLIPRVLSVLQNLSKDALINKSLQSTFHVHSAVSVFLQHYGTDVKDNLVLQCFHLLEDLTYDIRIDYIESHFENLIDVLLKTFNSESPELLKTTLHILSNICRHNVKVQNYILNLPNAKQIIKKFIIMLKKEESYILVYALSILASLTPNNSIGAKLWTEEHLMMTFDLILKLLFDSGKKWAVSALDLFLDLFAVRRYQACFVKSPSINRCLKRISKIICNENVDCSILLLRFLQTLTTTPECCEKVCSILCIPVEKDKDNLPDSSPYLNIHPKIVQWCSEDAEKDQDMPKIALQLLKSILLLHMNENFHTVEKSVEDTLLKILRNKCVPCVMQHSLSEDELEIQHAIFEILLLLCEKANFKNFISSHINIQFCEELAKFLLDNCIVDENDCKEHAIDLFLMVLEIISVICGKSTSSEKFLYDTLKDERTMQFLAYALSSSNIKHINRGLLLISLSKGECSLDILGKSLLSRNSNFQRRITHCSDAADSSFLSTDIPQSTSKRKSYQNRNESTDKIIDALLSKIENGLNMKDLKRSEIMDLYEHKIAMLTKKEQELQSYIEAKTAALQEADRVLTQYKCRQADADAEALKLRNMLKDFEHRSEKSVMQLEKAEQKLKEMMIVKDQEIKLLTDQLLENKGQLKMAKKEYDALEESKYELQKLLEETKKSTEKMKQGYEQKLLIIENSLEEAQQTISSLEEKNESLSNEITKKTEDFTRQLAQLQNEKEQLYEHLKMKDLEISDLNAVIEKTNQSLHEKCVALEESETLNQELKMTLEQTENEKTKVEQDVKMLELLCKRYESSLEKKDCEIKNVIEELDNVRKTHEKLMEEKDSQIKDLENELETHKYITGMIHQMTSKKVCPPNTEK